MQKDYGINMNNHSSTLLKQSDIEQAYIIIPVKGSLMQDICSKFPRAKDKLFPFPHDIQDPWHQPVEVYRYCARMIYDQFDSILEKI